MRAITYDAQEALLTAAFDLLNSSNQLVERLQTTGFKSFLAWQEFEEECCKDNDELAELPRYREVRAKLFFSSPDGLLGRDRKNWLRSNKPWGDRYDEKSAIAELLSLEKTRAERLFSYRQIEYQNWQNFNSIPSFDAETYIQYFTSVLEKIFSTIGFSYDENRSTSTFPVVSKPLVAEWDICWSARSRRTLCSWPRDASSVVQRWTPIELVCYIRSNRKPREVYTPIGFTELDFVVLRLERLVDGFGWAYSRINGVEQLTLCLHAYCNLYSLLVSNVEREFAELIATVVSR